jgi:oxygen-independent coproporphyrinogen-3 oxidase
MVGETWDKWRESVRKTLELSPDSVTIYQMELPFNTVFSKELQTTDSHRPSAIGQEEINSTNAGEQSTISLISGDELPTADCRPPSAVADWPTKRDWVQYAFDTLGLAGYQISSAYTMVKDKSRCRFVYRDSLWHGADMFGTGVASFGHVGGVHVQNVDTWEQYLAHLEKGELPLGRALAVTPKQLLIREMVLQLKTGSIEAGYFRQKFGVDVLSEFTESFEELTNAGHAQRENGSIRMTPAGLLQVDRLLPTFFEPEYRGTRYT